MEALRGSEACMTRMLRRSTPQASQSSDTTVAGHSRYKRAKMVADGLRTTDQRAQAPDRRPWLPGHVQRSMREFCDWQRVSSHQLRKGSN